ncbi:MAG TPA: hypothetical protein DIW24_07515 [Bacteroidetes bacterium]|nr:hypothetical protein [Bacteroidota bacterium]HRR07149.1 hypothetical protein [Rhodothermales bacterium]
MPRFLLLLLIPLLFTACRSTRPDPERGYPVYAELPVSVNRPLLPDTTTGIPTENPTLTPLPIASSNDLEEADFELLIRELEAWKTQDPGLGATDEIALYYLAYVREKGKPEANIYKAGWTQQNVSDQTVFSIDCGAFLSNIKRNDVACLPLQTMPLRFRMQKDGHVNLVFRLMELDDDADFALATQVVGGLTTANNVVRIIAKVPTAMLVTEWINYALIGANFGIKAANMVNQDDVLGEKSDARTWRTLLQNPNTQTQTFVGGDGSYQYKVRYIIRRIR